MTVKENILLLIWPRARPCATIIRENSDIWANDMDVKNDVRLW